MVNITKFVILNNGPVAKVNNKTSTQDSNDLGKKNNSDDNTFWNQSLLHQSYADTITTDCIPVYFVPPSPINSYLRNTADTTTTTTKINGKVVSTSAAVKVKDGAIESYTTSRGRKTKRTKFDVASKQVDAIVKEAGQVKKFSSKSYKKKSKTNVKKEKRYAVDPLPPLPEPFTVKKLIQFDLLPQFMPLITINQHDLKITAVGQVIGSSPNVYPIHLGDKLVSIDSKFVDDMSPKSLENYFNGKSKKKSHDIVIEGPRLVTITRYGTLLGQVIQPLELYNCVEELGGPALVCNKPLWQTVRKKLGLQFSTSSGNQLRRSYERYYGSIVGAY